MPTQLPLPLVSFLYPYNSLYAVQLNRLYVHVFYTLAVAIKYIHVMSFNISAVFSDMRLEYENKKSKNVNKAYY